jgi:hypothetical protein
MGIADEDLVSEEAFGVGVEPEVAPTTTITPATGATPEGTVPEEEEPVLPVPEQAQEAFKQFRQRVQEAYDRAVAARGNGTH